MDISKPDSKGVGNLESGFFMETNDGLSTKTQTKAMEYMETTNPFTKILAKLSENGIDTHAGCHKKDIARFLQYIDERIEAADIPNEEKDLLRKRIVNDIFPHSVI